MLTSKVSISGYRVSEELYNGSRTVVYQGYRENDSLPVAIKLLKNPYPSFSELVQFRNQYTISKNLHSSLIIQTYSLETYQNGYVLVMEDFGGISLQQWVLKEKNALSVIELLKIAITLCNTLDILYRERIIHKDIKPSNILINPQSKQIKLIDFSIASLLPRETQTLINPNVLEGTLSYISPEQTGRMNRGIDYRTDFYSLGVTLYELFTGELPFQSKESMELVHCHIAKAAPLAHEINPQIPVVISKIVNKLMAKNAEDRYQSALGLKLDLENCLHQLQETGEIQSFEIAQRDLCDRFSIPDKLYGRETEIKKLLQAFNRVSRGATEMMLISGFSGIGKTAVVNEVHKPIVQQRGYFIKGKFDQFNRNIPFSAFVQVFRDLMGQLLTESDAQIQQWKNQILAAVGENGQVIIEVVPELSRIIGEQPSATKLSGIAAQNRFNLLFQKFTQVFTSAEHPLVMFLDDLQWTDSASLKLIQLLMADMSHLFIIGAYRDNEVNLAHPLILTLSEIQKKTATINTINLAPLSQGKINQLVADTLKCSENLAIPLSQLIFQKTQGNPFFATQFLKSLHQDNIIQFDWKLGFWQCDIAQVTTQAVTDDVVSFMTFQLGKLPPSTQQILQLAACIGNQFDLATLAIVSEQSAIETAADLWKALQEGLILGLSDVYKFYVGQESQVITQENSQPVSYKFLHDRIQQAAYLLIDEQKRQATHRMIGQQLLHHIPSQQQEFRIFEIVNQLNAGIEILTQQSDKDELARLNSIAGRKAKATAAYEPALKYSTIGLDLLVPHDWQSQYELLLTLYELAVETAYLTGNFAQMEQFAEVVFNKTTSLLDQVKTYEVKIQACMAQNQQLVALNIAKDVLQQLGVDLPRQPTTSEIGQGLQEIQILLADKPIETLLKLPQMTASTQRAAMQILSSIISAAYQVDPALLPFVVFAHVRLSIQYGNAPESTYGYVFYGLMLLIIAGDIDSAYEFGRLGINLLDHLDAANLAAKTIFAFNCMLRHWKEATKNCLEDSFQAYVIGLETGDIEYAGLSLCNCSLIGLCSGRDLRLLNQEMKAHYKAIERLHQYGVLWIQSLYSQAVLNLIEAPSKPYLLRGDRYDEEKLIPLHIKNNELTMLYQCYVTKLLLSYLFQEYGQALENINLAEKYAAAGAGLPFMPIFYFYDSLTHLAVFANAPEPEQARILERVNTNQAKIQMWAYHAPTNNSHRYELVEAERYRVLGNKNEAIEKYDRAISLAQENEYINEEALANELAVKFYLDWGKKRIAQEYMINAYYGYARWGAKAKVADLERRYPQLLSPILQPTCSPLSTSETIFALQTATSSIPTTTVNSSGISDSLDLATVLEASQTISGEIELEKLLSSLLSIVIQNAGADKCVLMLLRDHRLLIKGSITVGKEPFVLQCLPVEDSQDIPLKLIYKVKHNMQTTVMWDATLDPTLANDPYIMHQQPKSILCSPILYQGKLLGIFYLENNLVTGAFTSDRVELLNLLCVQAAISLENARLYRQSQIKNQELEESIQSLQATQAQLQLSQEFLRLVIDNIPQLVFWKDRNSNFLGCNASAVQATNLESPEQIIGKNDHDFFIQEEADWYQLCDRRVMESGEPELHIIETQLRADGIQYWLDTNKIPLRDSDNNVIGILVTVEDISYLRRTEAKGKQAQEELEEKEQFLRSIYDGAEIVIFVIDVLADGSFCYAGWNPAAEKVTGISSIHVVGKTLQEVMGEEQGERLQRRFTEIVTTGRKVAYEEHINFNGQETWWFANLNPIKNVEGQVERIIGTTFDISDRKQIELALQQKSQDLEQALSNLQKAQLQMVQSEKMSALGNLVAGIAHEMNNPLGFIYASLQQAKPILTDIFEHLKLYQKSFPNPGTEILNHAEIIDLNYSLEDFPKIIDSMTIACDRLTNISTSLRTFSRADRDDKVPFNIHEGIDSTILILKHRLKANEKRPAIEVVTNYGNLPPIKCFPGQLNQVFMNIIANAIDALDESSRGWNIETIKINNNRIIIQTSIEHQQVKITIADNAQGMSEQIKQKIFDYLFTTKGISKGTGLGLAIAKQIIEEKHQGSITVNSTPGKGTEFIIYLSNSQNTFSANPN
ncbi:AAA family ATPase [Anabaena cylindrica FACHB-243]|uniref:histidine kinase n=1 Tax=Anabaena cylindrica (strain ATCC 27899 / PCC 7122) TaxID=272123 RepID=K9ZPN4_ANACC|nr:MULTISPECIES: trifunctional serine/threonine-protein kinase/ATP-binding protein/sensor histidine kinase [Anabaena]AFZ60739.1 multi-sensor signal transduction multi-kinase [Anabaena cylindrica PCC 7122]MBD2419827.1 AAA family ATPase [Anabaena cylindrica FACHB-243]MBY5285612.1 AAA family ATPase [Anabaena sp. CCAP 1446/1C]MBY5310833.1 AAA family ATPase [Anabaena sp. CCAP 1446/1C]MCM2406738.1 AAA family ATPase [Anabaena sp. CCAP 1446/1C]